MALGSTMKLMTTEEVPQGTSAMIQLHEAQSLLLVVALLILSFLVFRLLRPGASRMEKPDRTEKR